MPGTLNHDQKHRSAIAGYAGDKVRETFAKHVADGGSEAWARILTARQYNIEPSRVRELVEGVK